MPVTLSKIANNTADVALQIGEDTANIIYYPARITEKTFAQLKSLSSTDDQEPFEGFATLNSLLCHLIKSWDVYEDDEQTVMCPLDPDKFGDLPIAFRVGVLNAIMGDI